MNKFRISEDTTDIILDITKNDIVTISNETIMNIAQELQKSGLVKQAFVEGIGITSVLSVEEGEELVTQAKIDKEVKDDLMFEEHKDKKYQEWIENSDDEDYDNAKDRLLEDNLL